MLTYHSRLLFIGLALALLTVLSACAPLVVGGAVATTAVVATDRRTAGEQLDDKTIQLKINSEMNRLFGENARVSGVSYAGQVLLVGDAPTQADKERAEQAVKEIEQVTKVYNRLRVGAITPLSVRTNDTWITTKVMTALINAKDVPTRTMIVTTERGVVYLMGKVTPAESQRATKVAASVTDVNKVISLFDIVSPESIAVQAAQTAESESATPAFSPSAESSSDVQTMPVQ